MADTGGGEWVGVSRIGPDPEHGADAAAADALSARESIGHRIAGLEAHVARDREAHAALVERFDVTAERVGALAEEIADLRAVVIRSEEAVRSGTDALRQLSVSITGLRRRLDEPPAVDAREDAMDEIRGLLADLDRRMVSRAQLDDVRQRIEQAERSLAHQANTIGEAVRSRVDDQRVLAGELGAQLSALTASFSTQAPSTEIMRRDVQSTVEELAERVAQAMGDLRADFRDAQDSNRRALMGPSTRPDSSQVLGAMRDAQRSTDERLRRLDGQINQLQHSIDLLRWASADRPRSDAPMTESSAVEGTQATSVEPVQWGERRSASTPDPGDVEPEAAASPPIDDPAVRPDAVDEPDEQSQEPGMSADDLRVNWPNVTSSSARSSRGEGVDANDPVDRFSGATPGVASSVVYDRERDRGGLGAEAPDRFPGVAIGDGDDVPAPTTEGRRVQAERDGSFAAHSRRPRWTRQRLADEDSVAVDEAPDDWVL